MSKIVTNNITPRSGGSVGLTGGLNVTGNVSVGGTITYEDVTNVDSVGVITARSDVSIADKIIHTGDTNTAIRFPAADTFTVETAGSERFRVDSDGKVRVGSGDPAYNLEVFGSGSQEILIGSSNANGAVINFDGDSNGDGSGSDYAQIFHHTDGTLNFRARNPNGGTDTIFYSNTTERLRIASNGNATFTGDVSINSDKVKLYSGGQIDVYNSTTNAANQLLKIKSDIGGSGTVNASIFADGSATFAGDVTGQSVIGNRSTGGNAVFAGKQNGTQTTRINADGSATFAGTVNSGANPDNGANNGAYMGPGYIAVSRNGGNIFTGYKTGTSSPNVEIISNGNATFAGSITASNVSDIRFKENITDANPQLADAVALGSQLKNFDWNDDAPLNEELRAKRFLGLVAQEAEKVCPGLTYTVPRTKQGKELTPAVLDEEGNETKAATYEELDDSYKAINHDILVMKLLGAVAELSAEVAALKAG